MAVRKGRLLRDLLRPPKHRGKSAACADGIQGKRRKRRRRNRRGIAAYLTLQTGFFRGSVISGQDRCAGCCPIPLSLNRPIHFLCRIPFSDVCLQTQPLAFRSGGNCAGMTQKRKDERPSMFSEKCPCKKKSCPRHGDCEACREHHAAAKRKRPVYCERKNADRQWRTGETSPFSDNNP